MTFAKFASMFLNAFDCVSSTIRLSFFFQAEDGIRCRTVTGVQTCALPIFLGYSSDDGCCRRDTAAEVPAIRGTPERSEERRVGKECRSLWSPDHEKKKRARRQGCLGVTLRRRRATGRSSVVVWW